MILFVYRVNQSLRKQLHSIDLCRSISDLVIIESLSSFFDIADRVT